MFGGGDFDLSALKEMINDAVKITADEETLTLNVKIDMPEGMDPTGGMGGMGGLGPLGGNLNDPEALKQMVSQFGGDIGEDVDFEMDPETKTVKITCGSQETFDTMKGMFGNIGDLFEKIFTQLMSSLGSLFGAFGDEDEDED